MWILLGIASAFVLLAVLIYNRMVGMRRLTQNAWADVDVYLRRRAELVPNLVETVKGAALHERSTLERLAVSRAKAIEQEGAGLERSRAEGELSTGLVRALAIAESYPDLRVNQNFLALQKDLSHTETLIANARQYYNACVRDYNTLLESFPQSLVANSFGFKPLEFFQTETMAERSAPSVQGL